MNQFLKIIKKTQANKLWKIFTKWHVFNTLQKTGILKYTNTDSLILKITHTIDIYYYQSKIHF